MNLRIPQNAALLDWLMAQTDPPPRRLSARRRPPADRARCHPELARRLESSASGLPGVRLRYVAGFPVLVHPNLIVFGLAAGATWMAFRLPPAGQRAVVPSQWGNRGLGPDWVDIDPWLSMLPLHEGTNRVRGWCRVAYAHASDLAGMGTRLRTQRPPDRRSSPRGRREPPR